MYLTLRSIFDLPVFPYTDNNQDDQQYETQDTQDHADADNCHFKS